MSQSALSAHDRQVLESIFNPELPLDSEDDQKLKNESLSQAEHNKVFEDLERQGIEAAESGRHDEALTIFNKAVEQYPDYAASYNNRAQLYRLIGNIANAKKDLEYAIEKSNGRGCVASQAYTQRAMIRRLEGDDDGCRSDFQYAADLGNPFAKQQLVALNPYAALCNSMLTEMVSKIRKGEPENNGDPAA